MVFLPLFGDGFGFINTIKKLFIGNFKLTTIIIIILCIGQLNGYLSTQKHTIILTLNKDSLTFNFFNKTSITLKYSEIESLKLTKNMFKNFEFTLKNGEKKIVYATLKDKMKAFEEINKKLM
jgi:hypothetical protein